MDDMLFLLEDDGFLGFEGFYNVEGFYDVEGFYNVKGFDKNSELLVYENELFLLMVEE